MAQSIFTRFKDIMSSNINALLDKAEDPEKMIDQYLRDLESDLGNVKANAAAVMAEEKRCQREFDENKENIQKMEDYAKKALQAGNEEDARKFLQSKAGFEAKIDTLSASLEMAKSNAQKMRDMHDKLVSDIRELKERQNEIKAKITMAKTREKMNNMTSKSFDSSDTLSAFDRMEQKANEMLDKAEAMESLNASAKEEDIDNLMNKYDTKSATNDTAIDDELARLKSQMNLN